MIKNLILITIIGFAVVLIFPGSPIEVSYVVSGSMSPALETNDGYVLVPPGEIRAGDIITYDSDMQDTQVTHRVVEVTDSGFVTKGDANPSTDQAGGAPLVDPDAVIGRVLTISDTAVVIPQLGVVIDLIRTNWMMTLGSVAFALAISQGWSHQHRQRSKKRSRLKSRNIVWTALLISLLITTALVSTGTAHAPFVYIATESGGESQRLIPVGVDEKVTLNAAVQASPHTQTVITADGMRIISQTISRGDTLRGDNPASTVPITNPAAWMHTYLTTETDIEVTARVPAQPTIGPYETQLNMYVYPGTLPVTITERLHAIHPVVAAFVSVVVLHLPIFIIYWIVADQRVPLRGSRRRLIRRYFDYR